MAELNASVRRLFKGGVIVFVGLMIDFGTSFLGKVAISRYLGSVDYGGVVLGILAVTFVMRIGTVGVDSGVARYLPRYDDSGRRRGLLLSGANICLLTSIPVAAALFVFAPFVATDVFNDPSAAPMLRIFAVVAPFAVFLKYSIGVVRGMTRTVPRVVIQNVVEPVSRVVLIAVVVVAGLGAVYGGLAYAVPYVLAGTLGVIYIWRYTPVSETVKPVFMHRELLYFSAPLAVSSSMVLLFQDVDTFLVGVYLDTADVGVYDVVYTLAGILTMVKVAFSYLAMPILSEHHAEGEYAEMRQLYRVLTKWSFVGTFPILIAFTMIPELVVWTTFGDDFTVGAPALAVITLGFAIHVVVGPNANTLTTVGETKLVMYVTTIATLVNVGLNVWLIPRIGIMGAAVATVLSYFLSNTLTSALLYRRTGIHPFSRQIPTVAVIGTALFVAVEGGLHRVMELFSYEGAVAIGVIYSSLYLVILLLFATDEEELLIVRNVEDRFEVDLSWLRRVITFDPL